MTRIQMLDWPPKAFYSTSLRKYYRAGGNAGEKTEIRLISITAFSTEPGNVLKEILQ